MAGSPPEEAILCTVYVVPSVCVPLAGCCCCGETLGRHPHHDDVVGCCLGGGGVVVAAVAVSLRAEESPKWLLGK